MVGGGAVAEEGAVAACLAAADSADSNMFLVRMDIFLCAANRCVCW